MTLRGPGPHAAACVIGLAVKPPRVQHRVSFEVADTSESEQEVKPVQQRVPNPNPNPNPNP